MNRIAATVHPLGEISPIGDFGWACLAAQEVRRFTDLEGTAFGGSYAEASAWMAGQRPKARAFVVIFTGAEGMEGFLDGLPSEVASLPMAGGAAARGSGPGFTHPRAQDVAVLAIMEREWQALSVAAHFPAGDRFQCLGDDPRRFSTIRTSETSEGTVGADGFFQNARVVYGLAPGDWDRLALVTDDGIVLHLHEEGGVVVSGANLPASREVRLALFDAARGREAILPHAAPGALAFGCAGLFGLFGDERPWEEFIPTTYLFGELAVGNKTPRFANLTFSLLVPCP
ncbi:MAG: hypothetical protein ACOYNN_14845 [Terrimicrobiaceae bacterium]